MGKTNLLATFVAADAAEGVPTDAQGVSTAFSAVRKPTIGVEFGTKIVLHPETGKRIKAQIWDTGAPDAAFSLEASAILTQGVSCIQPGRSGIAPLRARAWMLLLVWQSFRSRTETHRLVVIDPFRHYRRAAGALVVYDVSNRATFDNAQEHWLRELRAQADPSSSLTSCVMLVGNKVDLDPRFASGDPDTGDDDTGVTPGLISRSLHEQAAGQLGVLNQRASAKTGANVCAAFEQLIVAIYDHDQARRERMLAQNRRAEPMQSFRLDENEGKSKTKKKAGLACCDQ